METSSMPLASDSFSYSWLSKSKSSLEEPHRESVYGFSFDTSITNSNIFLVHADEIFSDGFLRPIFVDPSKVEEFCNIPESDRIQTKICSTSFSSRTVSSTTMEIHHGFLIRWRKSTWRALVEFFRYFNPLRQKLVKVGSSRKSAKDDNIAKTDWQVKNLKSSSQKASLIGDMQDDHESSIYEAVLHCKSSIGK